MNAKCSIRLGLVALCASGVWGLSACQDTFGEGEDDSLASVEQAFNSANHHSITRDAMAAYNIIAVDSLVETSTLADASDSDERQTSAHHFLNCYWNASIAVIAEERAAAVVDAQAYHVSHNSADLKKTFTHLGFMVHAIEDFYAHSNWVEMHEPNQQVDFSVPKPAGWESGTYSANALDDGSESCPADTPTHTVMTKDTADRDGYPGSHQEAYDDAVITTRAEIQKFVAALSAASPSTFYSTMVELGFYHASSYWTLADVVRWPTGKSYFFYTNGQYLRFDNSDMKVDTSSYPDMYPMPVTDHWTGIFNGAFQAATNWNNGYAYFFKGNQYTKVDMNGFTAVSGYPKPVYGTGSHWVNWPSSWSAGNLDAAVVWNNGYAYFFRGSEYIKIRLSDYTVLSGYPRPIIGAGSGWVNWPSSFGSNLSGAFVLNDEHAYFFKGAQYIRVDLDTFAVDPDHKYPLAIKDHWPGL